MNNGIHQQQAYSNQESLRRAEEKIENLINRKDVTHLKYALYTAIALEILVLALLGEVLYIHLVK